MKAMQAIYQDGKVFFPFTFPETEGPVQVLVIFPQDEDPMAEDLLTSEDDEPLALLARESATSLPP